MSLKEKAMLVTLNISQWTARKLDKTATKEVAENHKSDINMGRYHKNLLAKEAMENIQKIVGAARQFHYENSMPWNDCGQRLLPSKNYLNYIGKIRQFKEEFTAEVEALTSNYCSLIQEARLRLNGLFNYNDYPASIQGKFCFTADIDPIPNANDFRVEISENETARIRTEIEDKLKENTHKAMRDLWERTYTCVARMSERLGDPEAIFRNTLIGNLKTLCELLPRLNVTDDPELEKFRVEIEQKLAGVNPDALRDNKGKRLETAAKAHEIMNRMSGYMG